MIAFFLIICLVLGLSYIMMYGLVYLLCLVLGLMFSSKLVVAAWGVCLLIAALVRKKDGRKQVDR